ncbi:MAG: transposase [Azoarcus sp.]|nr:transposase [Azoarcus sp.]
MKYPLARFHRTTILSSVRLNGTTVPLVFEGALNGELFRAYVAQCLAPSLRPGDIVVMDNLSSHKVSGVVEAIKALGVSVLFLPPYSPDLNPIERMRSKIKAPRASSRYARKRGLTRPSPKLSAVSPYPISPAGSGMMDMRYIKLNRSKV